MLQMLHRWFCIRKRSLEIGSPLWPCSASWTVIPHQSITGPEEHQERWVIKDYNLTSQLTISNSKLWFFTKFHFIGWCLLLRVAVFLILSSTINLNPCISSDAITLDCDDDYSVILENSSMERCVRGMQVRVWADTIRCQLWVCHLWHARGREGERESA